MFAQLKDASAQASVHKLHDAASAEGDSTLRRRIVVALRAHAIDARNVVAPRTHITHG